jgi:hypothetical protein
VRDFRGTAEGKRLAEDEQRIRNWKRWGTYLPARQWATVREDYSQGGDSWNSFDYETSRSRVYRWGEDGLLGWCDRQCRVAVAPALWNGRDDHLKERLFGLTGPEGNHGEDVKEIYYYLDATPTHSYCRARYRYPQVAFPYEELRDVNAARGREDGEYEITDTSVFDDDAFFDLDVTYAKKDPDTSLIRYRVTNHGKEEAFLCLLAQIWYRNVWKWGREGEDYGPRPEMELGTGQSLVLEHHELGRMLFAWRQPSPEVLFTENETDLERLYGAANETPWVKNAFHRYLVEEEHGAVNPAGHGTKAAVLYRMTLRPGESRHFDFLLSTPELCQTSHPFGDFDKTLRQRQSEGDQFYASLSPRLSSEDSRIWRQAYAGLLWSKTFYFYSVRAWLEGDPSQPPPPPPKQPGCHHDARHLGVSLVCRLGPGLSRLPGGYGRPSSGQGAAVADAARMVHAPQRAVAGLRVQLLRRQSAGARLGVPECVSGYRQPGSCLLGARFPQAAVELHLVGQPNRRRRGQCVHRRVPGTRQHRSL